MTENGTCPPSPSLPQHPETPPDPPVELPDEQIDPEPALPPGAIHPPPPEIGSHNYTFVLEKVKRQLGFRLDRQLVDIPLFRLEDLEVAIQNRWKVKVREILQMGREEVEITHAQMSYLRRHIGWLERYSHKMALQRDRVLYTMTDKAPEFFFPYTKEAKCLECFSTHDHVSSHGACFPLDQHCPQRPEDMYPGHPRRDSLKAVYIGTKNVYLHPALWHTVLNVSVV